MNSYRSLHPSRVNNSRDLVNHLVRVFVGMTLNTGPIPVRPETGPLRSPKQSGYTSRWQLHNGNGFHLAGPVWIPPINPSLPGRSVS